jgi:hypothetical protein
MRMTGGPQHRQEARPVEPPGRHLDEVPAQPVTNRAKAVLGGARVVGRRETVVPRRRNEVEASAIAPALRRALEARHEETRKQARRYHRVVPASDQE